jgi:hypothetical protein
MKKLVFSLVTLLATAGCSLDASIQNLSKGVTSIMQAPAKATGLVSGSTQIGTAGSGATTYKVQSTVGNYMSGIEQSTADGSYKVYSSVQGALVSNSSN